MSSDADGAGTSDRIAEIIQQEYTDKVGRFIKTWSQISQTTGHDGDVPVSVDAEIRNAVTHFSRALDPGHTTPPSGELDNAIWHLRNAASRMLFECCEAVRNTVGAMYYFEIAAKGGDASLATLHAEIEKLWIRCEEVNRDIYGFASRSTSDEDRRRQAEFIEIQTDLLDRYLQVFERLKLRPRDRDIAEIVRTVFEIVPDLTRAHQAAVLPAQTEAELTWSPRRPFRAGMLLAVVLIVSIPLALLLGSSARALRDAWPVLLMVMLATLPVVLGSGFERRSQ